MSRWPAILFLSTQLLMAWSRGAEAQTVSYTPAIPACCLPIGLAADLAACEEKQEPSNYFPPFNGCGPQDSPSLSAVLDIIAKFGPVDLTTPCDNHDICYGTCGKNKDQCDGTFRDQMYAACAGSLAPANGAPAPITLNACFILANAFFAAVSAGGSTPFTDGQLESCYCCDGCPDASPDASDDTSVDDVSDDASSTDATVDSGSDASADGGTDAGDEGGGCLVLDQGEPCECFEPGDSELSVGALCAKTGGTMVSSCPLANLQLNCVDQEGENNYFYSPSACATTTCGQ